MFLNLLIGRSSPTSSRLGRISLLNRESGFPAARTRTAVRVSANPGYRAGNSIPRPRGISPAGPTRSRPTDRSGNGKSFAYGVLILSLCVKITRASAFSFLRRRQNDR